MLPHSDREEKEKAQPHACLIFTPHTVNKAFQEQNTQKKKTLSLNATWHCDLQSKQNSI